MNFWDTGTERVLTATISGVLTIALISLALKNSSGLSKLISSTGETFSKVLKTGMSGG